ncbi:SpoIIE family protein phosphatase [Modestobacter sp. VKM Ac-2986]|uniref:GAF domain-containing SpoIIE family protein phosphatase n=1 Tax=Modestobacter sp. VKM Ac-2986 TaxID=3004140 RepID=UPI0022A9FAC6|nr:SpoIIE family protein phosphatase [Modestobacter sp. VKM Ac-2986]MCZ2827502.1 SpoIIE family protein phosphatase [Modestobacter sp. VKM Ac-2986]
MTAAADPQRLAAVHATELLDAESTVSFDRLTALARRLTGAPIVLLTIVDDARSYWLSRHGLPEGAPVQGSLEDSFCQHVLGGDALLLPDVRLDDRTRLNPAIDDMHVRAWAGHPIRTPDGHVLGSFCLIDTEVHDWTAADAELLADLAAIASREVELRATTLEAEQAGALARAEADRAAVLARIGELLTAGLDPDGVWQAITALAVPDLGDLAYVCTVERDGGLLPVAARHTDPAQLAFLQEWVGSVGRRVGEAVGPGHVASTGRAELVDASDPGLTTAQREAVDRLGIASSLVVPLRSRGRVAAVLTLARTQGSPPYSDTDRDLVTALAERAALVVENARVHARERTVSETMQRALLPALLPQPDDLRLASRYRPAGLAQLVGGDWYDAFVDATGATSLVIGDVAGHDVDAASTMGQLRTMLRMAGHDGTRSPAGVLSTVDAACETLGQTVFATALVARITEGRHVVRWSSAGHPPPLLLHPDGTVDVLTDPVGLPLGVLPDRERPEHETTLPPGTTLLLYTDGLIEQDGAAEGERDLDRGLTALVAVLARAAVLGLDVEGLCDRVVEELLPAAGAADDVALIAIRARAED